MPWFLLVFAVPLLWPRKAKAATDAGGFDDEQLKWIEKIRAEATKQGVPVEYALANAEVESNFHNVIAKQGGQSFGPMQVHGPTLKDAGLSPGEYADPDKTIAVGIKVLKRRLNQAEGDTELARIMYFCGPGWQRSCSEASLNRLRARWRPVAARWGVPARYNV